MVSRIQAIKDQYDERYFKEYAYTGYVDFPAHKLRVDKLMAITNPQSVLDVGCAYGYIVRDLLNRGISAKGCDISEWCAKQAQQIIPGCFDLCPAWELPYKDKQFDVLYCEGVLEHIPEDKINLTMNEFKRVALRRYLAFSLPHHEGVTFDKGHICLNDINWWFAKVPDYTWLFLGSTGTEGGNTWFYKG